MNLLSPCICRNSCRRSFLFIFLIIKLFSFISFSISPVSLFINIFSPEIGLFLISKLVNFSPVSLFIKISFPVNLSFSLIISNFLNGFSSLINISSFVSLSIFLFIPFISFPVSLLNIFISFFIFFISKLSKIFDVLLSIKTSFFVFGSLIQIISCSIILLLSFFSLFFFLLILLSLSLFLITKISFPVFKSILLFF